MSGKNLQNLINFSDLFNWHAPIPPLTRLDALAQQLNSLALDERKKEFLATLAQYTTENWNNVQTLVSFDGIRYRKLNDHELIKLSCSPGDVADNVFYQVNTHTRI